jgi:hypothetical protein
VGTGVGFPFPLFFLGFLVGLAIYKILWVRVGVVKYRISGVGEEVCSSAVAI